VFCGLVNVIWSFNPTRIFILMSLQLSLWLNLMPRLILIWWLQKQIELEGWSCWISWMMENS